MKKDSARPEPTRDDEKTDEVQPALTDKLLEKVVGGTTATTIRNRYKNGEYLGSLLG